MNKNKKVFDLKSYNHKTTFDNKMQAPNLFPIHSDKKANMDLSMNTKQNKIKDIDFKDITNIVKNSVEKINNLFSQTEFHNKKRNPQKPANDLKFNANDVDDFDEINKSTEFKKKERSNTIGKNTKTNFTFNINNFINVPNISATLPNISETNEEENHIENKDKNNIRSTFTTKTNKVYLNTINNKKNFLIEHKDILNKRSNNNENNNNYNNSVINERLFQIDEVQNNNNNTINTTKTKFHSKTIGNHKNIKILVANTKGKTNYNMNINKITDFPKSIKELKESGENTPLHSENRNNNAPLSGLTTIIQNKKVLYKVTNNKKKEKEKEKEKEMTTVNTAQKQKYYNQTFNRQNKHKAKQNDINQNQNQNKQHHIKRNDLYKNKLKIREKSQSKKLFKTGENFYQDNEKEKEKEKEKKEYNNNNNNSNNELNINKNINFEEIKVNQRIEEKNKKKNENKNNKQKKNNDNNNITVKTMDEINNNKNYNKINVANVSERISSTNSLNDNNNNNAYQNSKRRACSIPYGRKMFDMQEKEPKQHSSNRLFHQVVNVFYSKEFPNKINTNEILKLMLFFNEYLINNNLLNDYYNKDNQKLLDDYSKYISSKITVDFPQEHDIAPDPSIKCVKKIQRKWRKRKIEKYLKDNNKTEINELKHMIVNKYIEKSGYKIRKILGLFNTIVENFDNINKQPDINEVFYQIQKLINNKLTDYEKNVLYKQYINNVIIIHSK